MDQTVSTNVIVSKAPSMISRWSIAAAVFGAVCNLLCWGLSNYQHFHLQHERLIWSPSFIIVECLLLAPLLALFLLRRFAPVVFPYAIALLAILKMQIEQVVKFHNLGTFAMKFDSPGLLLMLLGGFSIAVVLVWAATRWVIFILDAPKSDRPAS